MMTISSRGPKAATLVLVAGLIFAGFMVVACTSVDNMYAAYQDGDESQFARIVDIAGRPDFPYATRKTAVQALGEIGSPRAVPVLIMVLQQFDRRTTLKEEALIALGRIGDPVAVSPIGHLLDRSLNEPNAEMRMAAMPVLGRLGGKKAAQILVNALMYYDVLMTRAEQGVQRGVFTGDEQYVQALRDSVRTPGLAARPGLGEFSGGQRGSAVGFFGSEVDFVPEALPDTTPGERFLAHKSLVAVGEPAVDVIRGFLGSRDTTTTLRDELMQIVTQIRGDAPDPVSDPVPEAELDSGLGAGAGG